jgi:hypothetical protein
VRALLLFLFAPRAFALEPFSLSFPFFLLALSSSFIPARSGHPFCAAQAPLMRDSQPSPHSPTCTNPASHASLGVSLLHVAYHTVGGVFALVVTLMPCGAPASGADGLHLQRLCGTWRRAHVVDVHCSHRRSEGLCFLKGLGHPHEDGGLSAAWLVSSSHPCLKRVRCTQPAKILACVGMRFA